MSMHMRNLSWYIVPVLGVILSLPTLLSCLAFGTLVGYEVLIKDTKGTVLLSALHFLQIALFAPLALYVVFGPFFACVLCIAQLTRFHRETISTGKTSDRVYRLTRYTLFLAAATIGLFLLASGIAGIMRGSM